MKNHLRIPFECPFLLYLTSVFFFLILPIYTFFTFSVTCLFHASVFSRSFFSQSLSLKGRIVGGEVASTAELMKMPAQLRASASFMFDNTKVQCYTP